MNISKCVYINVLIFIISNFIVYNMSLLSCESFVYSLQQIQDYNVHL